MDRLNFYLGQLVMEADMDRAFDDVETAIARFISDIVATGAKGVAWGQAVSAVGLTATVTAGASYLADGTRIPIESSATVSLGTDNASVSTAVASSGNEKWVSLFIKADTVESEPVTDGNDNALNYRVVESYQFYIVQGTEASSGTATRPALISDAVLLADALRTFGSSTVTLSTTRRQLMSIPNQAFLQEHNGTDGTHKATVTVRAATTGKVKLIVEGYAGDSGQSHVQVKHQDGSTILFNVIETGASGYIVSPVVQTTRVDCASYQASTSLMQFVNLAGNAKVDVQGGSTTTFVVENSGAGSVQMQVDGELLVSSNVQTPDIQSSGVNGALTIRCPRVSGLSTLTMSNGASGGTFYVAVTGTLQGIKLTTNDWAVNAPATFTEVYVAEDLKPLDFDPLEYEEAVIINDFYYRAITDTSSTERRLRNRLDFINSATAGFDVIKGIYVRYKTNTTTGQISFKLRKSDRSTGQTTIFTYTLARNDDASGTESGNLLDVSHANIGDITTEAGFSYSMEVGLNNDGVLSAAKIAAVIFTWQRPKLQYHPII